MAYSRTTAPAAVMAVAMGCLAALAACKADDGKGPVRVRDAAARARAEGCSKYDDETPYDTGATCTCAADCASGNCSDGKCCTGSACAPKRPDGAKCSLDGDCESKFCTDGVCCSTACRGPCQVCNLPLALGDCNDSDEGKPDPHGMCKTDPVGTCGLSGLCDGNGKCALYSDDTVCRPELCVAITTYGPPGLCNGLGKCILEPNEPCDPARCEANRCVITCASDAQCAPGKACVGGVCGEFPAGRTCATGADCLSNHCVDGVCCDTECDDVCMTCASSGKRGICSPVSAGTADPMCETDDPSTCMNSGRCAANGTCALYDNNTPCAAASCDEGSNTAMAGGRCNNGTCAAGTGASKSCSPYQGCSGNNCRTSCNSDAECVSGRVCSGGRCVVGSSTPADGGN